jgi:hypothetical protein
MARAHETGTGVTFVDLEFDTGKTGGARLGDIAASLVCIDDLLRDLASIAAYPSGAEFRNIEIVAIEMRSPLKITLSLLGISPDAVNAFQEICRDVILFGEGRSRRSAWTPEALAGPVTEQESQRLHRHVATLQHAAIPLKRVEARRGD